MEKLVCSNCKGDLKWNPGDRTFVCQSCGTRFQTDNEFTYRIVDEAKVKELELQIEKERKLNDPKEVNKELLTVAKAFGLMILLFGLVIAIPFILARLSR